jgi:hypothetical protein
MNNFVEPTRPFYGRVQNALEISGSDHDNLVIGLETVHFGKNLVYCVTGMRRVQGFTSAGYGVDFVDEDYRGSLIKG